MPWAVYDDAGILLLRAGYVIENPRQLDQLLTRGMYRKLTDEELNQRSATQYVEEKNPFDIIRAGIHRLEQAFQGIENATPQVEERILRLTHDLVSVCTDFPDAALGSIHLCNDAAYTLCHPIHQACLSVLVGNRLELNAGQIENLVAATLTANIGMRELQEQLHKQATPLTDSQRAQVTQHVEHSVALLEKAGIRNSLWLEIVRQHHERVDGSGYPSGLTGDQLLQEARILAIVDHYCARVSARAYREALPPQEQLRDLFLKRGFEFEETVSLSLIKELGIFPPGTFVRLVSGEVGVVIHRGNNGIQPIVSAIISPRGGAYARPLRRDCTTHEYAIKESARWPGGAPLNLSVLWGFA